MDRSRVEQIIQRLLIELGEDPSQERLAGTPRRVAELLEMFAVQELEPIPIQSASDSAGRGRMIIVPNLSFVSLCEHHLLPFFGQIHIGCIVHERACDAAYCARVVERFAHRPQLQERLTEQIADALMEALEPEGIGVAAEGRHMCMMMRGVEKQNSEIQSSTLRDCFFNPTVRRTFFTHVMKAAATG
jgi:GTP cyclohydrolase IA